MKHDNVITRLTAVGFEPTVRDATYADYVRWECPTFFARGIEWTQQVSKNDATRIKTWHVMNGYKRRRTHQTLTEAIEESCRCVKKFSLGGVQFAMTYGLSESPDFTVGAVVASKGYIRIGAWDFVLSENPEVMDLFRQVVDDKLPVQILVDMLAETNPELQAALAGD